ncbi:RICIN domain-containing protein [Streptomyces lateritius]|nr:RICIN domain-containing protein [Streptomyces lateritius]
MCADAGSGPAGTPVVQRPCTDAVGQQWKVTELDEGDYSIASVATGLVLTAASGTDGAKVTQQADTGAALQRWSID